MPDWSIPVFLLVLAAIGLTMRVRRKTRERKLRLDPCDAIEWHAANRRGELKR